MKNDNGSNAWVGYAIILTCLIFIDGIFGSKVLYNIANAITTGVQCKF